MDCVTSACLFGQKPDFKSFPKIPDWLKSDQWKPRYHILSQWLERGLHLGITGLPLAGFEPIRALWKALDFRFLPKQAGSRV
jgi:hypothetical protein